ncbi:alpha/beta hydrolase [Marivita sp. S6314]|uniref:alpha/beta hydrolase n=1 Tax=Marivita sp. S6314 TaxID=2926406 RepID=UPI001FF44A73|nr:alpha/beta hydrolase [Marivita sp. S6314]MCK0150865.1 alpha/beta hydrolase [Marivita sp. S6314]
MHFLLLPGINNTAATFDGTRRHMPSAHAAKAVDLPALPDVDQIAQAVLADAPERFVVVGHSFGGYVALAILAAAPERVNGVVLVNSNDWSDSATAAAGREDKAQQAEAGAYADLADKASARAYHPDNAGRPDLMAERAAALTGYGAARFAAHQRASAARPDRGALLASCGKPVLIVTGDHDVVIPTERQTQMAERLGAAQVIVAQAGHMLPAEQPQSLATALTDWAAAQFPVSEGA